MKMCPTCIVFFIYLTATLALGSDIVVGHFSAGDLSGWQEETFRGKGKTTYHLVTDTAGMVLKAQSRNAASGFLKKIEIDLKKYPVIRWRWKIEHSLKGENTTRKAGDDYAARLYVVFPSRLFWRTRAINYVWASKLPKNSAVPSPYTGNAFILAVESGDEKAGTWITEERNVLEDYRRVFGGEPPPAGAVAVMTDTDDTGDDVTAWYGDIILADR